jgi:hypothetical protein
MTSTKLEALIDENSPDFTAEDAASGTPTVNEDDFVAKVANHIKGLIRAGSKGTPEYHRKKHKGVNYEVVLFGGIKAIFKLEWLQ